MINKLSLIDFRCFENSEFRFSDGINLILGNNGSGKSSLIEAIYLSGRGKSFRSNYLSDLIRHGQKTSFVISNFTHQGDSSRLASQIESSKLIMKFNQDSIRKRSDLLDLFPLHLVTPVSHNLVDSGSSFRRKFIDWGLFHVEHIYRHQWSLFNRLLKQRNQALKNRSKDIQSWDYEFVSVSESIDSFRREYFKSLNKLFIDIQKQLLDKALVDINYYPGWNNDNNLGSELKKNIQRDLTTGWTNLGPQRADLKFNFIDSKRNTLSRGQQKMIVFTLQIAQCLELANQGSIPIFLIDDIGSELDKFHLTKLFDFLKNSGLQIIISAIDHPNVDKKLIENMFHVEQL